MARSRTSGEYRLGRAMGSILSRNEPSDEPGTIQMSLWKASAALRVLESLCFRHGLGPVVNCRSVPDAALFVGSVILELDSLSDVDKVFLTEAMILWLYEFRKCEGKGETFKHALLIEEAHHVLS